MSGIRGLTVGLLATMLVIGLLPGLAIARPGFNLSNWDVVLTYEYDSDGEVTYTENGGYDSLIDCTGGWTKVLDTTSVGPMNRQVHEFAIDYVTGKFGYIHIDDGTKIERHSVCSAFNLPSANEAQGDWVSQSVCAGECIVDKPLESNSGSAGYLTSPSLSDGFNIEEDDSHVKYVVRAATPQNLAFGGPYTGGINLLDAGGVTNEDGELVVRVSDWVVIGGVVWNTPDTFVSDDPECHTSGLECTWQVKTYPGTNLLGVNIVTSVGGFGHDVWALD